MIRARRSANGKFVVCGACGRSLCRRDATPDGFALVWDDDWREEPLDPAHPIDALPAAEYHRVRSIVTRNASALGRMAAGHAPIRSMPPYPIGNPANLPALCQCGTLNRIDPKRFDLVAPPPP